MASSSPGPGSLENESDRASPDAILSPEVRRVLATVRNVGRGGPTNHRRRSPDREALDGEKLLALALQERAVSVVWNDLTEEERSGLGPEVTESFRALSGIEEFQAREMAARLEEILSIMEDVGTSAILLKGAGLVHDHDGYGDVRQRPMFDLDLLVDEDRTEEVRSVLLDTGWRWDQESLPDAMYQEHCHLPPLQHATSPGTVLELHTDLFPGGDPFTMGGEDLRERSSPVQVGAVRAAVPNPTDHLVYICLHFAWSHAISRGGWRTFRDVAMLSGRAEFDWQRFVALAASTNGGSCCYWTLRLARDLGRVGMPSEVLDALSPSLPDALANALSRHFALQLFERWRRCPSVQLRRWFWSLAIRPVASGHGEARPWRHSSPLVPAGDEVSKSVWQRILWHGTRIRRWWMYLVPLAGWSSTGVASGGGIAHR